MTEQEFLAKWESKATDYDHLGALVSGAALLRAVLRDVAQLRGARDGDDALLSLTAAARVCGYSADHLGRLVRAGTLVNHGRPNAPRVRRGDLPRKPALPGRLADPTLLGASRRQVAQAITTSGNRR